MAWKSGLINAHGRSLDRNESAEASLHMKAFSSCDHKQEDW